MLLLSKIISRWTWLAISNATITLALAASVTTTLAYEAGLSAAEVVAFRFYNEADWAWAAREHQRPEGEVYARLHDKEFQTEHPERNVGTSPGEKSLAPARRSASFLSDAQISIIKGRLNLLPHQERYWPAVESALRGIFLRKTRDGSTSLDSGSVQRLYAAARDLVSSLNVAQLREVQRLARLVGVSY
jgi:hypothetical protein